MATVSVFWRDAKFTALEGVAVPREVARNVLQQWDSNAEFLSFRSGNGREHRIQREDIRRLRVDDS